MHNILFYNKLYFMPLHVSSTMCSSSGGQNFIIPEAVQYNFEPLIMSTWCSKHVEAWNKTFVKQKLCAASWLITKINLWLCLYAMSKCNKLNVFLFMRSYVIILSHIHETEIPVALWYFWYVSVSIVRLSVE